jgi:pimeloyl-ACP methyl ester carboxylesterase
MPKVDVNGVHLEYETHGPQSGDPVLLVHGLGRQLVSWPAGFIQGLTDRGHRVIRYDNRDVGLSWRAPGDFSLMRHLQSLAMDPSTEPPYRLHDMALDAVGLLDALGIERAHLVGVSLGGMIGQIVAAEHPGRVSTLTSIMSTTGAASLPQTRPDVAAILFAPPPDPNDFDAIIERNVLIWRAIGSPAYPADETALRDRIVHEVRRAYFPVGTARQMAAVMAGPDRREACRRIAAPTLVIHGREDPLVPVQGGEDTAAHVSGAELMLVSGMGHDLPPELIPSFLEAIDRLFERGRN